MQGVLDQPPGLARRVVHAHLLVSRSLCLPAVALDILGRHVILSLRMSQSEKDLMDEREFLAGYDPRSFDPVAVTVDVVTLTIRDGALDALLVQRGVPPF